MVQILTAQEATNGLISCLNQAVVEIRRQTCITLGNYINSGIELKEFFLDSENLEIILGHISLDEKTESLADISWFLFLLVKSEFEPFYEKGRRKSQAKN